MYILKTVKNQLIEINAVDFDEFEEYTVFMKGDEVVFKIKTSEISFFGDSEYTFIK